MKKIILSAVLLLLLCVCACADGGAKDPLWYQDIGAEVAGTLHTDTGDFYVRITLYPSIAEEYTVSLRDAEIEYTYPESLSGYKVTSRNGQITLSYGEFAVPCGDGASDRFFEIVKLFSIDAEALCSVTGGEDGITVLSFGEGADTKVSVCTENSFPVMIESGEVKFKIDEYLPNENSEVPSEQ